MLELRNVHEYFGDVRVMNGMSFRLEEGFVYTIKEDTRRIIFYGEEIHFMKYGGYNFKYLVSEG